MRKAVLSVIFFCVCLFISVVLSSCNTGTEEVIITSTYNINGKVINGPHNVGAQNVLVSIGDKTVMTDAYGYFSINDVKTPYDVYVSDTLNKTGSFFEGISYGTVLCLPNCVSNHQTNIPSAVINVTTTYQHPVNKFKVYFSDGGSINGVGENTTLTTGSCLVYLPDNKPVTGNLVIFKYTTDNNGTILNYNRFGILKDYTISPNSNQSVTIPDSIFKSNPGTKTISGTISGVPQGKTMSASALLLLATRDNYYNTPDWSLINNVPASFSLLIPTNLYIPLHVYISGWPILTINVFDSTKQEAVSGQMNYFLGAAEFNITFPPESYITSPPNQSAVDSNTVFTQTNPKFDMISHFTFTDSVRTFNVYTKSASVTMKNFRKFGFGMFPYNSTVKCTARNIGSYGSMVDFAILNRSILYKYTTVPAVNSYYYLN